MEDLKLIQEIQKLDDCGDTEDQIQQRIQVLLMENKNNTALLMYIELQKALDNAKKLQDDKKYKESVNDLMEQQGLKLYESRNYIITRVESFTKKEVNAKLLETKYPVVYREVLQEKPVKGHIKIKRKLEE